MPPFPHPDRSLHADATIAGVAPLARKVPAAAALFRQGDAVFGIFRLAAGRLRLLRTTAEGSEVAVHTVRPGELFAEAAVFSSHYHCDAIALRDCEVLVYPKRELERRLRQDPDALWEFTGELARRVQGLRTQLELRQVRGAPERVLQALRLRADVQGRCRLDGTLKQFSEEIGLTHEAVYRALALLERGGCIRRTDTAITVLASPGQG